jgi:hypothetical protein
MMKRTLLLTSVAFAMICTAPVFGDQEEPQLQKLSDKQLAELETKADTGRSAFFQGDCASAQEVFTSLSTDLTVSQPLYKCELSAACLTAGKDSEAFESLSDAYGALETFIDPRLEKSAAGLWGSETKKIYKGDPYEQATLCLLLGLMYLEQNDVDNALACFKSGQLADSDVANELYKCDYGLLQAMEAKCYELRNQPTEYDEIADLAVQSFKMTYPEVRELVSQKQAMQDQLQSQKGSRREQGMQNLEDLEKSLDEAMEKIDDAYGSPLFDEYNTLVIIWSGRSPSMVRAGQYGEQRMIVKNPSRENRYEVLVDGREWQDAIQGFGDVTFQATTRGGRMMDNVLANQAAAKAFTDGLGNAFIDAADDAGTPEAALAMLAIGLVVKGVGAAMNAEADIRSWQTLPDTFQVVPMTLAPGEHVLDINCFDQYIRTRNMKTKVSVEKKQVNVAFVNALAAN